MLRFTKENYAALKDQHISQIIFSISQISALLFCAFVTLKNKDKKLRLLLILLTGSFIQSSFQFFYRNDYLIELSISSYILLEFIIHSSIINNFINKEHKKISSYLIYCFILLALSIIIFNLNNIRFNIFLSCFPSIYIIIFGIIAIKNLINDKEFDLLFSFEFWIIYCFIFIHLCSLPIEIIEKYFLNKTFIKAKIIWVKAHQYTYAFYHSIIIYSLVWAKRNSILLRQL